MASYYPPTEKSDPLPPSVENRDHGESTLSSSQIPPSLPPKPSGEHVDSVSRELSSNGQPPPVGPRPASSYGGEGMTAKNNNCQQPPPSLPSRVRSTSVSHSTAHGMDGFYRHHRLSLPLRSAPRLSQPVLLSNEQRSFVSPEYSSHNSHECKVRDTRMPPLAAELKEERNKFKEVGKRMTLKEFSSRKKVKLPCLLKVCSGYTSLCERYSFGIDQLFVVIEIKTVDVVKMSEARSKGNTGVHEIPLQTDKFTVVPTFDPEWKNDLSRGGRIELHQLLECISLPQIVRVVYDFTANKGRILPAGTLLFPQEVKKRTKEVEKRVLVAKMEDGSSVNVTSDCTAKFDIGNTASFSLSLSQAVKIISLPFQCTLQSHEDDIHFTRTTVQSVDKGIFLFGVTKVKQGSIQDEIDSFKELSEIPANLGISVVRMAPKQKEILKDIYESAQSYYYYIRQSHPSNMILKHQVSGTGSNGGSPQMDPMCQHDDSNPNSFPDNKDQTGTRSPPRIHYYSAESISGNLSPVNRRKMLQGRTLPDFPLSGINRNTPASASETTESPSTRSVPDVQPTHADVCYSTANSSQRSTTPLQIGLPPGLPSFQKRQEIHKQLLPYVPLRDSSSESMIPTDLLGTYTSADDTIRKTPDITAPCAQSSHTDLVSGGPLTCQPNTPNFPQQQCSQDAVHTEAMSRSESESANIEILRSLDEVEILELLDAMNLGVYKDAFAKEFINGDLLSEIDEEMLWELGVRSSLHRMRLMRIVKGRENVDRFLISRKPYIISRSGGQGTRAKCAIYIS